MVVRPHANAQWPETEPPFCAGAVLVDPNDGAVDQRVFEIRIARKHREERLEDAVHDPTPEALEDRVPVPERRVEIAPGRAGAHDP